MNIRFFIEKKKNVSIENESVKNQLYEFLHIKEIEKVRIFTLYDVFFEKDIDKNTAKKIIISSLAETMSENYYFESLPEETKNSYIFSVSLLPAQYDQKADSASSCIMLVSKMDNIKVRTAKIYCISGKLSEVDIEKIKNYLVNPVDSYLIDLSKEEKGTIYKREEKSKCNKLNINYNNEIKNILKETINLNNSKLIAEKIKIELNLGMNTEDVEYILKEYKKLNIFPNIVEFKILDTYWSDHCRHTTFNTELQIVDFEQLDSNDTRKYTLNKLNNLNEKIGKNFSIKNGFTLMNLATFNANYLKSEGKLLDVEESDEINACSIIVKDTFDREWLVEFKNETHNHPTEIEPFGGASTCIGGCIRDPLSSRAYVFGALRVSGSANPNEPIEKTLKGKLPQRKITTYAAKGFSSYGNQIGLATGQVVEFYHERYVAKRLEAGAVIGAALRKNVVRKTPSPGNIVVLVGGRTGKDGIGGATGSSKNHNEKSIDYSSSEVQKGNPVIERKLQRFLTKPEVAKMILRCNDFGAGGVAVAVGEIADGLNIYLDKIPLKYEGLKPEEIILSESQERMACVIEKKDLKKFLALSIEEDLETTYIADIVKEKYVTFLYHNNIVARISRELLDSKGVKRYAKARLDKYELKELENYFNKFKEIRVENLLKELNASLQIGLNQIFDSTIGGATVFLPYGGKYQLSPSEGMAFTLPDIFQDENSIKTENQNIGQKAILMAIGFDPYLLSINPYVGAYCSIVESITKLVAMGCNYYNTRISLQEYFGKTTTSEKWGIVLNAMLGAVQAQLDLGIAAIGGKDSMSGTFNNIDVPPTLISFAVNNEKEEYLVPSCFMKSDSNVFVLYTPFNERFLPSVEVLIENYRFFRFLIEKKLIISARSIKTYPFIEPIIKSCFGNKIGFILEEDVNKKELKNAKYGSIIFETELKKEELVKLFFQFNNIDFEKMEPNDERKSKIISDIDFRLHYIGKTIDEKEIIFNLNEKEEIYSIDNLIDISNESLKEIFPIKPSVSTNYSVEEINSILKINSNRFSGKSHKPKIKPKVLILVFSGTNCEFDTRRAFEEAGAETEILVIKSHNKSLLNQSIKECSKKIKQSEIICLPGGFSMGDEPDGSGKFIVSFLKTDEIKKAIEKHISKKNLILGICNGFQALIKSGLLPYGKIMELSENDPSLVQNLIGNHVSRFVYCKVLPNNSPWHILSDYNKIYSIPVSHGEGRFYADKELCKKLFTGYQVGSIYVTEEGLPAVDFPDNPNGSVFSIESIISPDGLILGKMGHTERVRKGRLKNYPFAEPEPIFESAIKYFS